jgi:hypothetical protein
MTSQDQPRRLRLRRKQTEPAALRPEGVQPPVCEKLHAARQARGLDFFRIERDTKIRTRFLEAIEDGRFSDLPGEIYARGFIRNYAAYLGLDADAIETQWRVETGQPAPPPVAPLIKPAPRNFIPQPMPEPVTEPVTPPKKAAPRQAVPQPMPEPAAPKKAAASRAARSQATEVAAVEADGARRLSRPSVRRPSLPALPSLPSLPRPRLSLPTLKRPSVRLPFLSRSATDVAGAATAGKAQRPAVSGPEPMRVPARRFLLQPIHIVLLLMCVVVLAVTGFFAIQVTRILDYPTVSVTSPSKAVTTLSPGAVQYVLTGTATPGSIVRISWDEREPNTVVTDAAGRWQFETPLHSGLNQFDISARNEETNHNSDNVMVILEVPVPTASPTPKLLVIDSPTAGQSIKGGNVTITGTAVGLASVQIVAVLVGPPPAPGATARPSPTPGAPTEVPTMMPLPTATATPPEGVTPSPRPAPTPSPSASGGVEPVTAIPTVDGKFSASLNLTPGTWKLTAVGFDSEGSTVAPVEVTIAVPAPSLKVVIEVKGGLAWLKIWKDGVVLPGYSKDFPGGTVITILADDSVWIRTGSAVKTYVTVNGVSYGPLGGARSGSWRITAFGPPVPSQDL